LRIPICAHQLHGVGGHFTRHAVGETFCHGGIDERGQNAYVAPCGRLISGDEGRYMPLAR
jgi:hypothetical protein